MAINIGLQKCIHCLEAPHEITKDHVIPKSWFANSVSKNVIKKTAPACLQCNNELGKMEKRVSHLMWMSLRENNPLRPELVAKFYAACGLNPTGDGLLPGLNYKERQVRLKYGREMFASTFPSSQVSEQDIFPGFGYHDDYPKEEQRAVYLDNKLIITVAKKVIKGLEYVAHPNGRYVEPPYELEIFFPTDTNVPELKPIKELPLISDGTNLIQRGHLDSDPLTSVYLIKLWHEWEIWAVITKGLG